MRKSIMPALSVLLVLLLLLSVFANVRLIIFSRASTGGMDYSVDNSYLFASPLEATANSAERIRITAFVLNRQGRGVANKEVMLVRSPDLVMEQINALTDAYGRAIFDLTTNKPGEYLIEAQVDSQKIGEGIKIIFK